VSELVEHARRYADLHWALVRVEGKAPKGNGWQNTEPEPAELAAGKWSQWSRWNMGVVCGPSHVAILDVDLDDADAATLRLLGTETLPATPIVRTGSGRLQVYFADPGGIEKSVREGFELRVGPHMCVAPPSVHPETGKPYTWLDGREPWTVPLAPLPAELLAYFTNGNSARNGHAPAVGDEIPQGNRDATLASLAGSMRRRGMGEAEILAALRVTNEQRCRPPLADKDLERIAASIARYEPNRLAGTDPGPDPTKPLPEPDEPINTAATIVQVVTLDEFVDVDEPGAEALLGADSETALIPEGGDTMFFGDGGAGKTTLAVDLVCHLAAGDTWLGIPVPHPVNVLVIENEGPRPLLRKKLRRKRNGWRGSPIGTRVHVLAEPWAKITLRDEHHREVLAEIIRRFAIDVVVIGPVTASGMFEAGTIQQVREFSTLINNVRELAGRTVAFLLIHHENKGGTVSGAWEGVGDTLLHVQAQGHGQTRIFIQKSRWASVYHKTTLELAWTDGEGFDLIAHPEITEDTIADGLLAAVRETPGGSWSKIRANENVRGNATECARVRDRLLATGRLLNSAARDGYFNLWLSDDPAATRSEPGTGLERLPFPTPDGGDEPSRSPVPDVSRNGERNGTAQPGSDGLDRPERDRWLDDAEPPPDDDLERLEHATESEHA
jgi:hypothetical protein